VVAAQSQVETMRQSSVSGDGRAIIRARVGGDDAYWNTWRRKKAETYGRGCPADVSQYVETVMPGVCFSSLRAMLDTISVGSSSSVSCDEGLCDVSHHKLLCVCSGVISD
jgi:hypothetical protein